jgi:hypothetical protein
MNLLAVILVVPKDGIPARKGSHDMPHDSAGRKRIGPRRGDRPAALRSHEGLTGGRAA